MTQILQSIAEENNPTKNDFFNWLFNSNITIKLLYTDKSLYTVDYPLSAPDNIIVVACYSLCIDHPTRGATKSLSCYQKKTHIFIHIFRDFCIFFLMRRVCAPPTQLGWGSASKKGNFPMEQIRDTRGELASFQHHCFDIIIPTLIIITIILHVLQIV